MSPATCMRRQIVVSNTHKLRFRVSAFLKVFRCGPGCNISFSRGVRPALTNLGRWKPRGLVATYGERAQAGEPIFPVGAASSVQNAVAAVVFRNLGRECSVDWTLRKQRRPSFWMMAASSFGRSASDARSISKCGVMHRIMRLAPLVVRATLVSGHAGRSR